jgi:hypothetical protein
MGSARNGLTATHPVGKEEKSARKELKRLKFETSENEFLRT